MKRDHLMGYTGHLRALGIVNDRLYVRTPPRPPEDPAVAEERRLADKIATKALGSAEVAPKSVHGQEQDRTQRKAESAPLLLSLGQEVLDAVTAIWTKWYSEGAGFGYMELTVRSLCKRFSIPYCADEDGFARQIESFKAMSVGKLALLKSSMEQAEQYRQDYIGGDKRFYDVNKQTLCTNEVRIGTTTPRKYVLLQRNAQSIAKGWYYTLRRHEQNVLGYDDISQFQSKRLLDLHFGADSATGVKPSEASISEIEGLMSDLIVLAKKYGVMLGGTYAINHGSRNDDRVELMRAEMDAADKAKVEKAEAAAKKPLENKAPMKKAPVKKPGSALEHYRREAQEIWQKIFEMYGRDGSDKELAKRRDALVADHCAEWDRSVGTGAGKMTLTQLFVEIDGASEMLDLRIGLKEWHETLCNDDDEDTL